MASFSGSRTWRLHCPSNALDSWIFVIGIPVLGIEAVGSGVNGSRPEPVVVAVSVAIPGVGLERRGRRKTGGRF